MKLGKERYKAFSVRPQDVTEAVFFRIIDVMWD